MSISIKFSPQYLNGIFSHLSVEDYKVFWIRTPDYEQQLYISPSFETVWKRPCARLFEYPASWNDYLIGENVNEFVYLLKSRVVIEENHKKNNSVLYRIRDADGQLVWIKDSHFYLINRENQLEAVAGIAQAISETQWKLELKRCCDPALSQVHYEEDLLYVLKKELQLKTCHTDHALLLSNDKNEIPYVMTRSGAKVLLSKREIECLHYLAEGKAAKEIARKLDISSRTVEIHIANIKGKMKCKSSLELISQIRGFAF